MKSIIIFLFTYLYVAAQSVAAKLRPISNQLSYGIGDPSDYFEGDFADLVHQEIGDFDEGDLEEGEIIDVVGEIEEMGSLAGKQRRARRVAAKLGRVKNPASAKGRRLLKRSNRLNKAVSKAQGRLTYGEKIPFVAVKGLILQQINVFENTAAFETTFLKPILDRSALETPAVQFSTSSNTPATPFGTSYGVNEYYLYPCIVIKLGTSALQGIPNAMINITAVLPVLNGTTSTVIIQCQLEQGFDGTCTIWPYQLIQGKPVPVFGKVGGSALTTDEILISVTGLPSDCTVSLTVPYSASNLFKKLVQMVPVV